jgi:hypothetical protein
MRNHLVKPEHLDDLVARPSGSIAMPKTTAAASGKTHIDNPPVFTRA